MTALTLSGVTKAFGSTQVLRGVDLHVPARNALHEPLAVALVHEWPAYAAYVTSFLIIGIIWVNHHAVFELVGRVVKDIAATVARPSFVTARK